MGGTIVTDTSAFPLVVVHFSDEAGRVTDEVYQAFIDAQRDLLRRGSQFATVADVKMSSPASASQRKMLTDWLSETDSAMRRWAVGLGVVVRSSLIRGGLRAVFWVKEPAVPTKVVASVDEGVDYCFAQLEAHRVFGLGDARQRWAKKNRTV